MGEYHERSQVTQRRCCATIAVSGRFLDRSGPAKLFTRTTMEHAGLYTAVKGVALLVIVLMVASILYAGYISATYWAGIGV
jgi:hypothetical protein